MKFLRPSTLLSAIPTISASTIPSEAVDETKISLSGASVTGEVSTLAHGFVPKATGNTNNFLNANGAYAPALPAGMVNWFAMTSPPSGWIKANGAAVSRTTFAALFTAIGTTFGVGGGSTTFNVPDLRGEYIRGFDDAKGTDTGRVFGSSQTSSRVMSSWSRGGLGYSYMVGDFGARAADLELSQTATGVGGSYWARMQELLTFRSFQELFE